MSQTAMLTLLSPDTPASQVSGVAGVVQDASVRLEDRAIPEPMEMVQWRKEVDARAEALLTEFDGALATGGDAAVVAHNLLHGFIRWTRLSVERFSQVRCASVELDARQSEKAVWIGIADLVSQTAEVEPNGVDRFLRIWLAVVHEASATGQAWLYCR
jgi:hypothetical protein